MSVGPTSGTVSPQALPPGANGSGAEAPAPAGEPLPPPTDLTLEEIFRFEEMQNLLVQGLVNANIGISNMALGMVRRALDDDD